MKWRRGRRQARALSRDAFGKALDVEAEWEDADWDDHCLDFEEGGEEVSRIALTGGFLMRLSRKKSSLCLRIGRSSYATLKRYYLKMLKQRFRLQVCSQALQIRPIHQRLAQRRVQS